MADSCTAILHDIKFCILCGTHFVSLTVQTHTATPRADRRVRGDRRQAFRTRDKFFAQYLRSCTGSSAAVIVGSTARGRSCCAPTAIKLIELPVGSPQLSAIEGTWRILKRDVRVPGQPRTLDELRIAVGEYLRTKRFNLNIYAYLNRKVVEGHTNFSS